MYRWAREALVCLHAGEVVGIAEYVLDTAWSCAAVAARLLADRVGEAAP
jgi:hypothetical protein